MPHRIVILDAETTSARPYPCSDSDSDSAAHPAAAEEPRWDPLAELGHLHVYPRTEPDELIPRVHEHDADVLVTNKTVLNAKTLAQLDGVKLVTLLSTGTNVIDLDAAREHGITVCNVPGYSTESVVQHVFALLLALVDRPAEYDREVKGGRWVNCPDFTFSLGPFRELSGKTLGIVGVGDIGKRVAQVGHALGMSIVAARQRSAGTFTLDGLGGPLDIDWRDVDDVFVAADVLTLHCPLNPQTEKLVNAARLATMKPGAILINTGRGGLIDEAALAAALTRGRLRGAGLDVLSTEPPAPDNPLLAAPRCLITPHIAWATVEARTRLIGETVANIRGHFDGRPRNVVT